MSSQEDPEARIRELEQADHRAVELGTSDYTGGTQSAHLPPPVYTDPYATSPYTAPPFGVSYPPTPRKGTSVGLVFGLIAVAVVMVVGAISAVMLNVMSDRGSVYTGEGGTTVVADDDLVDRPAMPRFDPPSIVPGVPADDEVITAPVGAPLSVAGVDGIKTVVCDDNVVSVSGVNNDVTITGHCVAVTVSGVDNTVSVDSADTITASGFDNQVTYFGGEPQVNNFGDSNTVERG